MMGCVSTEPNRIYITTKRLNSERIINKDKYELVHKDRFHLHI